MIEKNLDKDLIECVDDKEKFNLVIFEDYCHKEEEKHLTEWIRIGPNEKIHEGTVEISGELYDKYLLIYCFIVIGCKHPIHENWNAAHGTDSYTYIHCAPSYGKFEKEYEYIKKR